MGNYDEDDFFDDDNDFFDNDEQSTEDEPRRKGRGFDWRKIELARERLALRRELGDFDFGIE